ncbi:hypothetical protein ACH5RR_004321 [Cinchona calisaya]|uniref:Uncharacterized protein n=1 Tax=Cinchona calisaya TaxID=153742 RepID=A0ABD3AXA5_9GENT
MLNPLSYLLLFAFVLVVGVCEARSFITPSPATHTLPYLLKSFNILPDQGGARSCSYSVTMKTSCSSSSDTRDKVSLAFGDASGNEVYAPRLDEPSSGTFDRCSTDTFKIRGPCVYDICYLYLLRVGSDGWKPQTVRVYGGPDGRTLTFNFNTFLPDGVWYGFDHCNAKSSLHM